MFVLIMLTVVGIGVGPTLGAAFTTTKAGSVARGGANGLYAADGGMEYAISDLRAGAGTCSQTTPATAGPLTGPTSLNGLPVAISATCSTVTSTSPQGSMSSIVIATVTSTASISTAAGGGANGSHFTASAVVDINQVVPARNTSVVSWSSVEKSP